MLASCEFQKERTELGGEPLRNRDASLMFPGRDVCRDKKNGEEGALSMCSWGDKHS